MVVDRGPWRYVPCLVPKENTRHLNEDVSLRIGHVSLYSAVLAQNRHDGVLTSKRYFTLGVRPLVRRGVSFLVNIQAPCTYSNASFRAIVCVH